MKLGLSSSLERPGGRLQRIPTLSAALMVARIYTDKYSDIVAMWRKTSHLWRSFSSFPKRTTPSETESFQSTTHCNHYKVQVQTWVRILPGANLTNDENLPEDAKEPNCNTSTDPYRPWCHASVADGCCRCCDRPYQALARSRSLHMWASAFHAHASSLQPDAPSLQPDVSSLQPLRQGSLPPPPVQDKHMHGRRR